MEREGKKVMTWEPDGYCGKTLDVYLDTSGRFHVYLTIGKDEEEVDVTADTFERLKEKASKTLLQKRPEIFISGHLVNQENGKTVSCAFVGLHAGTGNPRFRDEKGKAVVFDRWGSDDSWNEREAWFIPDGAGDLKLEAIIRACTAVRVAKKKARELENTRDQLVANSPAIQVREIHEGWGRMKKTELAQEESAAAARIQNLIPGGGDESR